MRRPPILVVLSNAADPRRVDVEDDAVRALLAKNLLEDIEDSFRCRIAVTQEIEIPRASKRLVEPRHQQHGPFQNETVGVAGLRQP